MFVPSGKKIRLIESGVSYLAGSAGNRRRYGSDYVEVPMYLGEDLNIKTSSQYSAPFASMQESAASLGLMVQTAGAALEGVGNRFQFGSLENLGNRAASTSFQNQNSAFQLWKFSDPVSFSFSVKFFLGIADLYHAKREVYYPSLRLMSLVLPTVRNTEYAGGRVSVNQLIPPGPTISNFVEASTGRSYENNVGKSYSIYIGKILRLSNIIIKDVEATFSHEVDTEGYPITSTVRMSIETQQVGTTNMIDGMLSNRHQRAIDSTIGEEAEQRAQEETTSRIANWASTLIGL